MPQRTALKEGGATVTSGKNFDREAQSSPGWCYASVERMIKRAYGVEVGTQREIATNYQTTMNSVNLNNYVSEALDRSEDMETARTRFIEREWGNPTFDGGPTAVMSSSYSQSAVKNAIDGDELAIIGSQIHWYVIYGYQEDSGGTITHLLVWDPYNGGADRVKTVGSLNGELFTFS